jgi:hypothetical protein
VTAILIIELAAAGSAAAETSGPPPGAGRARMSRRVQFDRHGPVDVLHVAEIR